MICKPNNPWNDNPCFGVWGRKTSRTEDSWGVHYGETYYSSADDWDGEIVTLHSKEKFAAVVGLKPEFVYERFDFLGHGESGWG